MAKYFMDFMEQRVAPFAKKMENQAHIAAIRDGFIVLLPFLIVGSFMLILFVPPFDKNTTNAFGQAWWGFADAVGDYGWRYFQMSFNAISLFCAASIAYNLAKNLGREPLPATFLSLMTFLLIAFPVKDGTIEVRFLGGLGLFTAMFTALLTVELTRLLERMGLCIRLQEGFSKVVAESFNMLIPTLAVAFMVYPLTIFIETSTGSIIPEIILGMMKPLISASDSIWAIILFTLAVHLLWFVGINGALILMQLWTPFLLQNMTANLEAFQAGEELPYILTNSFWDFYVTHGGSGGLIGLAFLCLWSRSKRLKTIGRAGFVPSLFSITDPVMYGSPVVLNPFFFIPLIIAPVANAIIAYLVFDFGLIQKVFLLAPWTTPAPIGAFLVSGGDFGAPILATALIILDIFIYYPFFKAYEKTLIAKEHKS